jgi:hypothetical protein
MTRRAGPHRHNGGPLNDDDARKLWNHIRALENLEEQKADINLDVKARKELAKADGFDTNIVGHRQAPQDRRRRDAPGRHADPPLRRGAGGAGRTAARADAHPPHRNEDRRSRSRKTCTAKKRRRWCGYDHPSRRLCEMVPLPRAHGRAQPDRDRRRISTSRRSSPRPSCRRLVRSSSTAFASPTSTYGSASGSQPASP